jgi:hypothetical protein
MWEVSKGRIDQLFSIEQQTKFLTDLGYVMEERKTKGYRNVYHNDVEEFDVEYIVPLLNGKPIDGLTERPDDYNKHQLVSDTFNILLKKKILHFFGADNG